MKKTLLSILVLSSISVFGQSEPTKKYEKEPETSFEIFVNDKKYVLVEGKELIIDTLVRPKIVVKQSDYKKFENSSFSFEYPKHLAFEFNESIGLNTWTLSGNSTTIIIFQLAGEDFLDDLVDGISEKFGKNNCTVKVFKKRLGAKLCKGKRMEISLAGEKLLYDCYEIESDDSFSNYIFIQDSLEEMKHTAEYERISQHLDSTIIYK